MRVVVLGDTHMPKKASEFPSQLIESLKSAELIIHTGDWSTVEVVERLEQYAVVKGVFGNVDEANVIERFSNKEIFEVGGYQIGVVHGDGTKGTTEKRALEAFDDQPVDVILFGHSHIPYLRYHQKKLLINPGSPTDRRQVPAKSFVILDLHEKIEAKFVFL